MKKIAQNKDKGNNKTIGQQIAEYRQRHRLSKAALAELVGCTAQTIGEWERGRPYNPRYASQPNFHRPGKKRKRMLLLLEEDAKPTKADINVNTALVYRLAHLEKEMKELTEKVSHLEREARND